MSTTLRTSLKTLLVALTIASALALVASPSFAWAEGSADKAPLATSSATATAARGTVEPMSNPSVTYRVKLQTKGWSSWASNYKTAGKTKWHKRATAFQMQLDNGGFEGNLQYRVRLNSGKWKGWKNSGTSTGTSKRIEALQIRLTGALAEKYDVVYRVYVQDVGWQRRMRNGETAGTTGKELRIEGLRVKLVSKKKAAGWINDDGDWSYYKSGKKLTSTWLDSKESPIDEVLSGSHRYWLDSRGVLAVDRFVNPNASYDKEAGYVAYATGTGNVAVGKYESSVGMLLAQYGTGQLYNKTRWLTTSEFDGTEQKYRLVKHGIYATVQTGFFTVKNKKYYGYEDGRGYVMRSGVWWVVDNWYKASKNGVLKVFTGSDSAHIERYVKWAIATAKDDSHGYSQAVRWGPDYDCSSFVCAALLAAGFPNSGAVWTGNMKSCLKKIGFKWHKGTKGLKRGDIMLVHNSSNQHTEIYLGNNQLVGAHSSETGGIYGKAGDQTGREISITGYYNMPWQGYLRYRG